MRCTVLPWSTLIIESRPNPGTGLLPDTMWLRNELSTWPARLSVVITPPFSQRVRNRYNRALTRSLGIRPVPSTSHTYRGGWGGSGATMEVKRQVSIGRRCHWHPWGLCLGDFRFHKPIRGKGRRNWNLWLVPKGAVSAFLTFPVFCGFQLDPLSFFSLVWPSSAWGTPKTRLCLGSSHILLS